jgi:GTPase
MIITTNRNVALVGRPNVGKSRLFNCLARKRLAIVHNQAGVTRDVNTIEIDNDYVLMDTGGIGLVVENQKQNHLIKAVEEQVFFAIQATTVILFIVDAIEGLTPLDQIIAEQLRKADKKIQLTINKIDSKQFYKQEHTFAKLGFEKPIMISAEHSLGISTLRERIQELLGPPSTEKHPTDRSIKICFTGRSNVGKSSLCNSLLKNERLIVSEEPGTTRDTLELNLDYKINENNIERFCLIDTAGMRKQKKINTPIEWVSSVKAQTAIEKANIVFLVLDARTGVTTQDKNLAGKIIQAGRNIAILVNKWDYAQELFQRDPLDGYQDESDFRKSFEQAVKKEIFFLPASPILFVSALRAYALETILKTAIDINKTANKKLPTGRVNNIIEKLIKKRKPRMIQGKRFKIYYAVHTGQNPHCITLYCNQKAKLEDTYQRYLEKGLIKEFNLQGCPVKFNCVSKERRYKQP